jgi:hypothetical protein
MNFPLSLLDIVLWLGVMTAIVLATSELLRSSPEFSSRLIMNEKRLRIIGLIVGLAFFFAIVVYVVLTF